MWKRIREWWAAEGALVGLQGLSDRMLADMGLERQTLRERVMPGAGTPAARTLARCRDCAPTAKDSMA